jgi:hypothetical protein
MQQQGFILGSEPKIDYPFYTEDSFERKLRRYRQRQTLLDESIGEMAACDYLERAELQTLLEQAQLTGKQDYVFNQYMRGCTLEEIGRTMHVSKQAVAKTLGFAIKKVKRAWGANPYYGLADVYREEVNRYCKAFGRRCWR